MKCMRLQFYDEFQLAINQAEMNPEYIFLQVLFFLKKIQTQ